MYRGLNVAVVMPAFNEEGGIATAMAAVPDWVDHLVVIDDASRDETAVAISRSSRPCVSLTHPRNRGVGAAISSGYRWVLEAGCDVAVVMAGDGQMSPHDLTALLDPIAAGDADYVKGNRFARPRQISAHMPKLRIVGNVALSLVTKVTSGYWNIFDSQCGYTAISRRALEVIELGSMFPRYGYCNDLLARLRVAGARVRDVPVETIYGPAWNSGITLGHVIYPISFVLVRSWLWRIGFRKKQKRLSHPVVSG
jgi:glycosyltransferase involved in cell wall biosynthesis